MSDDGIIEFEEGQTFHSWCEGNDVYKIHIAKVIDEGLGVQVVYRYFGKRRRWWFYAIVDSDGLIVNIKIAKNYNKQTRETALFPLPPTSPKA